MTNQAGVTSASDHPILHAAIAIAPQIRASVERNRTGSPATEANRRCAQGRKNFRYAHASVLGRATGGEPTFTPIMKLEIFGEAIENAKRIATPSR